MLKKCLALLLLAASSILRAESLTASPLSFENITMRAQYGSADQEKGGYHRQASGGIRDEEGWQAGSAEGNALFVCENGLEMFGWDLAFIKDAKKSIEISGSICGGQLFRTLLEAVEERLIVCPELKVHVLLSPVLLQPLDEKRLEDLKQRYRGRFHSQLYNNVPMMHPYWTNIEHHVKCVIVDEYYFSTGGTNLVTFECTDGKYTPDAALKEGIVETQLPSAYRDGDVVGRGPLALELRRMFFQHFAIWEDYFAKGCAGFVADPASFAGKSRYFSVCLENTPICLPFEEHPDRVLCPNVRLIFSGPHQSPNAITAEYERLIDRAEESIWISNVYFSPFGTILEKLKAAANREVRIELITNGTGGNAPEINSMYAWANRLNYVPLLFGTDFRFWESTKAAQSPLKNTWIYEYNVRDVLYHKKVMVIDKRYTVIGSYNLGLKSHVADYEMILVIDSRSLAALMLEVLRTDRRLSRKVLPEEALGWYFNPVTSYLGGLQRHFHGFI